MFSEDIKKIPALMKEQKEAGKKDLYIELTDKLLTAFNEIENDDERREYVSIVDETLSYMDFQIYELYRSLEDARDELRRQSSILLWCRPGRLLPIRHVAP